jgi:hypothetical protein
MSPAVSKLLERVGTIGPPGSLLSDRERSSMADQERGFAPIDPSDEDDPFGPERKEDETSDEEATDLEAEADGAEMEDEAERPRRTGRELVRLGWVALVVFAVIGLLMVVELVRISSAVNNNGCILKAQAHFLQAVGPGVTPQYAGLDRLTGLNQLNKCGQ